MNKSGRKRFSLFDIMFVAVVTVIVAAISIPALLASRHSSKEAAAVADLRAIHAAQVLYRKNSGANTRFATFDQLRANGLLPGDAFDGGVKNGYVFEISLGAGAENYCGKAAPVARNGARSFGVDRKGVVYQAASPADIECAAGVLTTTGKATPVY